MAMAFRDSWHRALVYFGLAEERAYVDEYEIERQRYAAASSEHASASAPRAPAAPSPRPRWRIATASVPTSAGWRSRRPHRDDFDDIFADDEPRGSRPTTVLRPVERRPATATCACTS